MKIGFVGLGIMGESMSENIVKKHDDDVYVFDFVKGKVELLESKGAIGCSSSLELAEKSEEDRRRVCGRTGCEIKACCYCRKARNLCRW